MMSYYFYFQSNFSSVRRSPTMRPQQDFSKSFCSCCCPSLFSCSFLTLISFLAYYTECSLTKLFLYSRSLHYYCFTSILHFINIYCSRVAVCLPIVLSIKRIYHHCTRPNVL